MTEIFNRNFVTPHASLSQKIRPCTIIDFTVVPFFRQGTKINFKKTLCCRNMVNIDKWQERLKKEEQWGKTLFFQLNCLSFIKRNFFSYFLFCFFDKRDIHKWGPLKIIIFNSSYPAYYSMFIQNKFFLTRYPLLIMSHTRRHF